MPCLCEQDLHGEDINSSFGGNEQYFQIETHATLARDKPESSLEIYLGYQVITRITGMTKLLAQEN